MFEQEQALLKDRIKDFKGGDFSGTRLIKNMPAAIYHAKNELNYSRIKTLLDCPAKFNDVKAATSAMRFGSLFHMYVLEPDAFSLYVALFDKDLRTKAAKKEKEELEMKGYKYFISSKELSALERMYDSIFKHKYAELLLKDGHGEVSGFFELMGIKCRCRFDYIKETEDAIFVLDLKTTASCRPRNIQQALCQFDYHIQAAFYRDAMLAIYPTNKDIIFINFFVENALHENPTNHISSLAVTIPEIDIQIGQQQYLKGIEIYKECLKNNDFYDYDEVIAEEGSIVELGLFDYKRNNFNEGVSIL